MSAAGFAHLGREVLFEGHILQLERAHIEVPDGSTVTREIIRHPGAVAVVAVDDDGSVILERQYRAALDVNILEIPAGKRDIADEPPETCARRELVEETGYDAECWEMLGEFYNSPGFTDEHTTLFLATGLREVGANLQGPEEEAMELVRLPLASLWDLVSSGELDDAKSILGLSLALHRLGPSARP